RAVRRRSRERAAGGHDSVAGVGHGACDACGRQPGTVRDQPLDAGSGARVNGSGVVREDRDGVCRLRLDRPPRNLLEPAVMESLVSELEAADADAGTAAIVLTGTGDVFCGGLDIP